jgi:hypothetical protein
MATNFVGPAKVSRIYSDADGCYIRLDNIPTTDTPKGGYFQLLKTHTNYNALYSLALTAATNGLDFSIRTVDDISSTSHAEVQYMVVDWP